MSQQQRVPISELPILPDEFCGSGHRPNKYADFPIAPEYKHFQRKYVELQQSANWFAWEITAEKDAQDFLRLPEKWKRPLKWIHAFFHGADVLIANRLTTNIMSVVTVPIMSLFWAAQVYNENVHSETYTRLLMALVPDAKEQAMYMDAMAQVPSIGAKAKFIEQYTGDKVPLVMRLLANLIAEGVMFQAAFMMIFHVKRFVDRESGQMCLNDMQRANLHISRDEAVHADFLIMVLKHAKQMPDEKDLHQMFREAVAIECDFVCDMLDEKLSTTSTTTTVSTTTNATTDVDEDKVTSEKKTPVRRVEWTSPEQPGVWDTIRAGIDSLRGLWTSSTLKTTSVKDEKVKTRPAVMKRSKSDEVLTNDVTADTACDYVRFKADCILAELGYAKLFNVANPFPWMEVMTTRFKSNFFEVKDASYTKVLRHANDGESYVAKPMEQTLRADRQEVKVSSVYQEQKQHHGQS